MSDESYIKLTLELAKKGRGNVSPNPLVGCVIIKDDRIIGAGYHQKFGENHAEVNAIESASESVEGATLYVNLEPCSHHGKTPPCADLIIEKKISKVVIGTLDMNPAVSGQGVRKLKAEGIDVKVGVLEKECIDLNKFFFQYITKRIPYVTLKAAQTLDGKIADINRDSKWISSLQSRKYVHSLRANYDAVLIGIGTVEKDNPSLTVRLAEGRNPRRVVLDTNLRIGKNIKLLKNNGENNLIVITSKKKAALYQKKIEYLESKGVEVLIVKEDKLGRVDLKSSLKELAKRNIASVLVEGGKEIYTTFIKDRLFNDLKIFVSPKLIGEGLPVVGSMGIENIKNSMKLKILQAEKIGDDILIELSR